MDLKPGQTLGAYRIEERLVSGGMAKVYRARQASTGREVAIKVLPALQADAATIERFEREMRVLAGLQHPRILGLIDAGREEGWHYLVLPLVRQGDLADLLARENGPLPLPLARRIALQLCEALEYAHAQGVIHRDLKPANVLRDDSGNVLLSDFGIARTDDGARLTLAGQAIGTPEYLAPEQAEGRADPRSDLYALGLILYETLTGRLPFAARTAPEWLRAQREMPVPSPRSFNPQLPEALDAVVLRALAKDPDDRFQNAAEFAAALRNALPAAVYAEGALPLPGATRVLARDSAPPAKSSVGLAVLATLVAAAIGIALWAWSPWRAPAESKADEFDANVPAPPQRTAPNETKQLAPAPMPAEAKPTAPTPTPAADDASAPDAQSPAPAPRHEPAPAIVAPAKAQSESDDVYDTFADARFDGRFDPTRWQLTSGSARVRFVQRDGAMLIQSREQQHGLLAEFAGTRLRQVSMKLKLSAPVLAAQASIGVTISRADGHGAWLSCYVYATRGANTATPVCTDQRRQEFRSGTPAAIDRWHEVGMRIDEQNAVARLSADGQAIGELPLTGSGSTTWYVMLSGWSADAEPVDGMIGELRIERTP